MTTPATISGLGLMGFQCCSCSHSSISTRCDNCMHRPCSSCTLFDHAGRMLGKHLAVGLHWLCKCGEFLPVIESLVKQPEANVCACGQSTFVALYNNYGRLCEGLNLGVKLPFALVTQGDVNALVQALYMTSWGPCIRVAIQ